MQNIPTRASTLDEETGQWIGHGKVCVIRRSRHPDQPGESADSLSLSYPCAIDHDGELYVGYSNNGGRRGNLNSAELAIIPIEQIK